jgi:hypothetical protein
MKKLIFLLIFLISINCFSQWSGYPYYEDASELDGGIGMSWIDNHSYYTISFQPDISLGKFGIGLGVNLLYDQETGKLRSQDWDSSQDFLRIIRYLRYGHKNDPFYTKIGALDAATIGHGFILNYYNNQVDYDKRKLGLLLDADLGKFGFESLTNNLVRLEVLGGRVYYRPLYNSDIPILKNIALGLSYITDIDPDSSRASHNTVAIWGADIELPLIKSTLFQLMLYTDHAQIIKYGSGQTVGLQTDFIPIRNFLECRFTIEKRFLGKEFIPGYFGPFYEILRNTTIAELIDFYYSQGGDSLGIPEKYQPILAAQTIGQQDLLPMMNKSRSGWFTGLSANVLNIIKGVGYYQKIDGEANSGMLHFGAILSPKITALSLEATYDKRGIGKFKDITTLDYRSVARIGCGYRINPFLLLYLDYIWNFTWDEELGCYKPQERFQPRLAFRYRF